MTGRILVVDDLEPNRRLLQIRLEAEYYDIALAENGQEALDKAFETAPDLILLDVMMPIMDGFEACRLLKSDPRTRHTPVVILTALDQREDRLKGLEAGADDFLSKPWSEAVLLARVRSLLRLKAITDELASRQETRSAIVEMPDEEYGRIETGARILIIDDPGRASERLAERLEIDHRPRLETDAGQALRVSRGPWDLVIIDFAAEKFDGAALAQRLKSDEATRDLPILAIVDGADEGEIVHALGMGVNDVIDRPVDRQELMARVRTLVKRKRFADFLRARMDEGLQDAACDTLTGVFTRRTIESQLRVMMEDAGAAGGRLCAAMIDVDGLAALNAARGHNAGDAALKAVGACLRRHKRDDDLVGRAGGDEFLMVLPGLAGSGARQVLEALRLHVSGSGRGAPDPLTVSTGVAEMRAGDGPSDLLDRAGKALEAAKERGRNRVVLATVKSVDA